MSDTKNAGDKTISVATKPRLSLKRGGNIERDTVRQSFSHGRTNTVQVERKKKRVVLPGEAAKQEATAPAPARPAQPEPVQARPAEPTPTARQRAGLVLR